MNKNKNWKIFAEENRKKMEIIIMVKLNVKIYEKMNAEKNKPKEKYYTEGKNRSQL